MGICARGKVNGLEWLGFAEKRGIDERVCNHTYCDEEESAELDEPVSSSPGRAGLASATYPSYLSQIASPWWWWGCSTQRSRDLFHAHIRVPSGSECVLQCF